jgi:hypothetical protein
VVGRSLAARSTAPRRTVDGVTEHQPYDVVRATPDYELRRYPAHVVAETEAAAGFEAAGNAAFRPLVSYISGSNVAQTSLAMTAPVVQQRSTIDVSHERTVTDAVTPGRYVVAFVLPADVDPDHAPVPTDTRVRVRAVPEENAAAVRFSGRWTESGYRSRVEALLAALDRDGLETAGPPRFARFDPPWTPWFLRHNEVVVPLTSADAAPEL